jgi:hypothetical protein
MIDDERDQKVVDLLLLILDHPAESWDKAQVDDMRLEVECGEYENPFTNLIATGLQADEGFTPDQMKTLNTLIQLMNLENSEWVQKLRAWEGNHSPPQAART